MNQKLLMERNKIFTINCINLANELPDSKFGNHLKGQLLRSSSSVAANYRAARLAQSKAAFIAKLSIVIEEADESEFWIDLGIEVGLFNDEPAKKLRNEAHELASIYIATRKTLTQHK